MIAQGSDQRPNSGDIQENCGMKLSTRVVRKSDQRTKSEHSLENERYQQRDNSR